MKIISLKTISVFALLLATGANLHAQKTTTLGTGGGGSAHVRTDWTVAGANISITYGRPAMRGRAEAKMMPIGAPWRTGADEATVIKTDKTLHFGTVTLAPGNYTINTEPGATEWKIIFGKLGSEDQWGIPYLPNLEIGRAPMKLGTAAAPVELVTFAIDPSKDGGTLKIEWGTKSASTPFTVAK